MKVFKYICPSMIVMGGEILLIVGVVIVICVLLLYVVETGVYTVPSNPIIFTSEATLKLLPVITIKLNRNKYVWINSFASSAKPIFDRVRIEIVASAQLSTKWKSNNLANE